MTTYVAPVGDGLGDLIVSLPAVEEAIRLYSPVVLVLRSPRQFGVPALVPGLSGLITESEFIALRLGSEDRFINLRDHPLQAEHVWGSPEFCVRYPGFYIVRIVEQIAADKGLLFDPQRLPPLPYKLRQEACGKLAFIPGTAGGFKHWPGEHWLNLARYFKERGRNCFVIGLPDKSPAVSELIESGLEWIPSPDLSAALDLISSSLAVVSVDTGLMHLAVRQKKPTVAMYTRPPIFLRTEPNAFPVLAPECAFECVRRLFENTNLDPNFPCRPGPMEWDCVQPGPQACMNQISVASVIKLTENALCFAEENNSQPSCA